MSTLKDIPSFESEDAEREFWSTHSFLDYVDLSRLKQVAPLVPHPGTLSVEVAPPLADEIKRISAERSVPIDDVIRQLLSIGLKQQQGLGNP
jgi:hypothetical protein